MIRLGLTGFPLEHSLSPRLHSAALAACGLQGEYCLFPAGPEEMQLLQDLLNQVRSGAITGLNVTIPHKQYVIPFLDELTPTARAIGAVNTIYMSNNRLIGHNTDAQGFLTDLKHVRGFRVFGQPSSALVLGAGGAARAVVYALIHAGWDVSVAARRLEQAVQLAEQFEFVRPMQLNAQPLEHAGLRLVVNATPAGMAPDGDQSPWPEGWAFPPRSLVYDLVYQPRETRLIRDARAQGLKAMTGLGMLVAQAALSFQIWTGCRPSREAMRAAVA